MGEIELAVPRKRDGSCYFPSFLEPRRPAEQAIVSVIMEAHVNLEFLRGLRARGPGGVRLCVSDHHEWPEGGDRADPRLPLTALHAPLRAQHAGPRPPLGLRPDRRRTARDLQRSLPRIAELLEGAEEDLLAFYRFPAAHWSKLRRTNPFERLNKEIGRRADVVGIFPTTPRRSASRAPC